MRRFLLTVLVLIVFFIGYDFWLKRKPDMSTLSRGEAVVVKPQFDIVYKDITYSYNKDNLNDKCEEHEAICAIDLMLKCTIDPKMEVCTANADKMPKFIFMEDENLVRPTEQTFKISKIKPVDENTVEIFTNGTCNGQWFGLCSGKIIYVLDNQKGFWRVKDVYAITAS